MQSLLGLQAEDDDGDKASQQGATKIPTGTKFSDRDKSKDGTVNKTNDKPKKEDEPDKKWIAIGDKAWNKALDKEMTLTELREYFKVSKANGEEYLKQLTDKIK